VGTGARNAEKETPPQAVKLGGAGKRAGGPGFPGPRAPRNELYFMERQVNSFFLFNLLVYTTLNTNLQYIQGHNFYTICM